MKKIILVDDNIDDLDLMDAALSVAGFEIYKYEDPRKAYQDIGRVKPNVFISDYYAGVMKGKSLIALVKKQFPNLPCIIVSGLADNLLSSEKISSDAIIQKTATYKELRSEVACIFDRQVIN